MTSLNQKIENTEFIEEVLPKSGAMNVVERLPMYGKQFYKIEQITDLIGDLANAFAGKPLDYQREFTANTRTALAGELIADELNFQAFRPDDHDCHLSPEDGCNHCLIF